MRKVGDFPSLPAKQLAMVLENLDIRVPLVQLCKRLGISDRTHRDWRTGLREGAEFKTADKILTRLGLLWWDVWNEETTRVYVFTVVVYSWRIPRKGSERKRLRLRAYSCVDEGPDEHALRLVSWAFSGDGAMPLKQPAPKPCSLWKVVDGCWEFTGENGQGEQLEMAA